MSINLSKKALKKIIAKAVEEVEHEKQTFSMRLLFGEREHALMIVKKFKDSVKVTELKGGCGYSWNVETLLWEYCIDDQFSKMVIDYLSAKFEKKISKCSDAKQLKQLYSAYKRFTKGAHGANVWKLAKIELQDKSFLEKVNRNPDLLPIRDGNVVDLRTRSKRCRTKEDMFSFELKVDLLEKDHELKHAKKFFNDIMGDDQDKVSFLTKMLGYSMTGRTDLRVFQSYLGKTTNGKSTLLEIMEEILGLFCVSVDEKVIVATKNISTGASPHLMCLQFCRLAVFSETAKGQKINGGLIKAITGQDKITARGLYKDQIVFRTQGKLVIVSNCKLRFDALDGAMIKRFLLFPFAITFKNKPVKENERKLDKQFVENLKTKWLDEVFTLLCDGAKRYYDSPECELPESLKDAKNDYLHDMDTFNQFLNSCTVEDKTGNIPTVEAFEQYKQYCEQVGLEYEDRKEFHAFMRDQFESRKVQGEHQYYGIKLSDAVAFQEDENDVVEI